jgi:hypothetical protein
MNIKEQPKFYYTYQFDGRIFKFELIKIITNNHRNKIQDIIQSKTLTLEKQEYVSKYNKLFTIHYSFRFVFTVGTYINLVNIICDNIDKELTYYQAYVYPDTHDKFIFEHIGPYKFIVTNKYRCKDNNINHFDVTNYSYSRIMSLVEKLNTNDIKYEETQGHDTRCYDNLNKTIFIELQDTMHTIIL